MRLKSKQRFTKSLHSGDDAVVDRLHSVHMTEVGRSRGRPRQRLRRRSRGRPKRRPQRRPRHRTIAFPNCFHSRRFCQASAFHRM